MTAPCQRITPVPDTPPPLPGDVHLWRLSVSRCAALLPDLASVISPDEDARFRRFRRSEDRDRAILARAFLRLALSRYGAGPPETIRLSASEGGKPGFAGDGAAAHLRFNVSHSGDLVLLAFALVEVGVDVERVRTGVDFVAIAERFFSADEREAISRATDSNRADVFFRVWTRKEAVLKAAGTGLMTPLPEVCATRSSGEPVAAVRAGASEWWLLDLDAAPGYAAALASAKAVQPRWKDPFAG